MSACVFFPVVLCSFLCSFMDVKEFEFMSVIHVVCVSVSMLVSEIVCLFVCCMMSRLAVTNLI